MASSVTSPKFRSNILTLSEQQYFVWDTASISTKRQDVLDIWGAWAICPPGYAYAYDPWHKQIEYYSGALECR